MPSRPDRVRVWNGELKRTRGGLMRIDLVKNKAGKIVSKRRSTTARSASNLGKWLRVKGSKFRDVPEGAVKRKAIPKPKTLRTRQTMGLGSAQMDNRHR